MMTLAFFQQPIIWEDIAANHQLVEQTFAQLTRPVDVMVVPETFSTGFSDNMARMAESPEGPTYQFAARMARQYDALFVGTWTVKVGDAVFNRLHWVYPDGSYGFYDKGHTFRMSSEASQLQRGRQRALFEWRGWNIKPAICYDLRFPKWLRNAVPANERHKLPDNTVDCCSCPCGLEYDLLLVCANWPASRHEAWTTLLKARAIENLAYVAGVNRVGTDGVGIPYSGNSLVADFKGHTLVEAPSQTAGLFVAQLDKEALSTFRNHWPFYLDFD